MNTISIPLSIDQSHRRKDARIRHRCFWLHWPTVAKELLSLGHQVLGLARSDKAAQTLEALGAKVQRGSLEDLESLKQGAAASDGVIHLAFVHDFGNFEKSCRTDRQAIEAIGAALAGSDRPLVIASGTLMLPQGHLGTEDDGIDLTNPLAAARGASETLALSLVSLGVRASVVRLPPTVHGDGDHGFIPQIIATAREKGVSAYVGDGLNRWPAVHLLDAARLFVLVWQNGRAGSTFHAVSEEGVTIKEIAEIIGKQLGVPVAAKTMEEAQSHFGFLAHMLACNNPTSSAKTQEQLGWSPSQPSLIADLNEGTYYKTEQ